MTTTPRGLDTLAEAQKMQDAGVPPEQAETMLYAAIRASEAHIAEMRNDIGGRFDALDTRFDALETKIDTRIEALETKIEAVETGLGGQIEGVGSRISAVRIIATAALVVAGAIPIVAIITAAGGSFVP